MRYVPHTENGCGKVSEYKKAVAYRVAVFFHVYVYGENKWIGLILHFMSCVCFFAFLNTDIMNFINFSKIVSLG